MTETRSQTRKPISRAIPEEVVRADLERYRHLALELGATDAAVIPANMVVVDPRVRMKCLVPRCVRSGSSGNCPPHVPDVDTIRETLAEYSWAVLFSVEVAPLADFLPGKRTEVYARPGVAFHRKCHEIVCQLESQAFRDGYYLALGLDGGSCKSNCCYGQDCQYLETGNCRYPFEARPSMESMSIDVFDLVTRVGWDIYPVCRVEPDPGLIPRALSVGVIFVY